MWIVDSFVNLLTSLGTAKDPYSSNRFVHVTLSRQQLEAAYRSDWIARKGINIPARDATRAWRTWQAENADIEKIEELEKAFNIRRKVYTALDRSRLYGGAALIIGCDVGDPSEELLPDMVKPDSLKWVHVVNRYELSCGQIVDDIQSPYYGEPESYTRNNGAEMVKLHPSRVVRFIGNELPDRTLSSDGWGDSVLQGVHDAVKSAGVSLQSIAQLMSDMKVDVIKIPGFTKNVINDNWRNRLWTRWTASNQMKSQINALLVDENEEWDRVQTQWGGLPDVLKIYLLVASGAFDIPATRMLGQSATGLNSTGDNDIRNYYDRVSSEQNTDLTPALDRLDAIIKMSVLGSNNPDAFYEWAPLWQMTSAEKAAVAKQKADAFKVDADTGLMPASVLAKARVNQLIEDGTYPGLEGLVDEHDFEEFTAEKETLQRNPPEPAPQGNEPPQAANENDPAARRRQAVDLIMAGMHEDEARTFMDAAARSLYVRRQVTNAAEIIKWAKGQGLATTVPAEQMHVTIMYSRTPVDWMKMGQDWTTENSDNPRKAGLVIPEGGPRVVSQFGEALVLEFASTKLGWRHESMKHRGCSYDWDEYAPHITLTWQATEGLDISKIEPYRGAIELGPEIFEEVKDDESWRLSFEEDIRRV